MVDELVKSRVWIFSDHLFLDSHRQHGGTGLAGVSGNPLDRVEADGAAGVPVRPDTLPDGRESLMVGEVTEYAGFSHHQGDNPEHFQNDCGLASVQDVLLQFGARVTEGEVVTHALEHGECQVDPAAPGRSGATRPSQDARILGDYGLPSSVRSGQTIRQLARSVEQGHGIIIGVNSGVLWQIPALVGNGGVNHAVAVTGVALDPQDGSIQGFYVNDSGNGKAAEFVGTVIMRVAWEDAGGWAVVTDRVHRRPRQSP